MKKIRIVLLLIISICSICFIGCLDFDDKEEISENQQEQSINYIYKKIGESFIYDDLEITINSFKFSDYIYASGYIYPDKNTKWLTVNAHIYNPTNKTKQLRSFYAPTYSETIIYKNENGDESRYSGTYYYHENFIYNNEEILSYGTVSGIFAYKIPVSLGLGDNVEFYFEFCLNEKTSTDVVRVILEN